MMPEDKAVTDKEMWTAWFAQYIVRLKLEVDGVEDVQAASKSRTTTMNQHNPRYESIHKNIAQWVPLTMNSVTTSTQL